MEKVITHPRYTQDASARELVEHLDRQQRALGLEDAVVYYDFPVFQDYDDAIHRPNIMILSPQHGLIVIQLVAATGPAALDERLEAEDEELEEFYSLLFSRLIKSKQLRESRTRLNITFVAYLFLHGGGDVQPDEANLENGLLTSIEGIERELASLQCAQLSDALIDEARSIIEGAKALTRPKQRNIPEGKEARKAKILAQLEQEIANFDINQRRVALSLVYGPQRIRGLAGSGKTIVLAMKAAYIHLNDPDKLILVTFYTRSLYDFIRRLITRFYRHYKDVDPDWEKIHVYHAWGGRTLEGVYYNTCVDHNVMPLRLGDVPIGTRNKFAYVCDDLLKKIKIEKKYDHVLIDEAQDFPDPFFKLCYQLVKGERDEKSIIWAYDDLQNIFNVKRRSTRQMFGEDEAGNALVDLERAAALLPPYVSNDVVLYKCYRNPVEILICAHALGFGIYSDTIVQMLENRDHWEDVGYQVISGDFNVGSEIVVERPRDNSPLALPKNESKENIVRHYRAADFDAEVRWIVNEVRSFIDEGLQPHDILVICLDDRNARGYFRKLSSELVESGIEVNDVLSNPYTSSDFAIEDKVTLSTVYRAKGNEAAVVFAIGIDSIYSDRKNRIGRNRLFTAFTRAKAWLRVTGVGRQAEVFFAELRKALANSPRLKFVFPDPEEVEVHQRDLSEKAQKKRALQEEYRRKLEKIGASKEEIDDFFGSGEKK